MRLDQFIYELSYRQGHLQHVSDSLSRLPLPTEIELDDEGEPLSAAYMMITDLREFETGQDEVDIEYVYSSRLDVDDDDAEEPPESSDDDGDPRSPSKRSSTSKRRAPRCVAISQGLLDDDPATSKRRQLATKSFTLVKNALFRIDGENKRLVVSTVLTTRLVSRFHDSPLHCNVGRKGVIHQLRDRYYWNQMQRDVGDYISGCSDCRKAKPARPKRAGLLQQRHRGGDLEILSIDLFVPLSVSGRDSSYKRLIPSRTTAPSQHSRRRRPRRSSRDSSTTSFFKDSYGARSPSRTMEVNSKMNSSGPAFSNCARPLSWVARMATAH